MLKTTQIGAIKTMTDFLEWTGENKRGISALEDGRERASAKRAHVKRGWLGLAG